ncbi:MAG TPA: hypothetical protein VHO03_16815 [Ignavibacteriales bacterium]|nr:hypothetical protein [Ignavibacteriales bacterium]
MPQQEITSMGAHTDVLLVLIFILATALIGTIVFIFKVMWSRQKQASATLDEHQESITKITERIDVMGKDVETALKKSEEIEKNYIKKFDELRLGMEKLGSSLNKVFSEGITDLKLTIEKNKTENEKYFLSKEEYEKMQGKFEKIIDKLTERVNEN